ncbi:MAG: hypothetical protein C7B45_16085 [Sulfobacillus acidophilus]|uniref:Uncharacterized protein n=1 Tax=Sulfobacillus acidophilus TaxID=53633 RepID=A0A2T2WD81_9FIRM|nr:MAG: hypothetical protein C7B45_16085 [Sulfobacillus acidophilus]
MIYEGWAYPRNGYSGCFYVLLAQRGVSCPGNGAKPLFRALGKNSSNDHGTFGGEIAVSVRLLQKVFDSTGGHESDHLSL